MRAALKRLREVRSRVRQESVERAAGGALDLRRSMAVLESAAWTQTHAEHLSRAIRYLREPPPALSDRDDEPPPSP